MKIFVIQAYGGRLGTNGHVRHFVVQADSPEHAIGIVRETPGCQHYDHLELVQEGADVDTDQSGIVAESNGAYTVEATPEDGKPE